MEEIVRFIRKTEEEVEVEEIEERIYKIRRYLVIIRKIKKEEKEGVELSIIYPADKNKNRKTLSRRKTRAETETEIEEIERVIEEMEGKKKGTRKYKKTTYKYRGGEVLIIEKENKRIVIGRAEGTEGEAILEEIKNKLKIWIDLEVPSEEICEYII